MVPNFLTYTPLQNLSLLLNSFSQYLKQLDWMAQYRELIKNYNRIGPIAQAVVKWAVVNNEAWQPTPKTRDIKVWTFSVRTSKHAFAPAFNKEVIKNDPLWTKISHRWWTQKLLLHALSYLTGQHPLKWRFDRSIV